MKFIKRDEEVENYIKSKNSGNLPITKSEYDEFIDGYYTECRQFENRHKKV